MKALCCQKYGPPENLELQEVPIPVPKPNEILIKVKASAVNDFDWSMVRGIPRLYRLMFGLFRPKRPIPGMELAGVVEAKGDDVKSWEIGDEVYGDISESTFGSLAEYICVPEVDVKRKSASMTFVDAAAIPHASLLAYQGLVDLGKIKAGDKVLINGAGGGVGTFGVQIAKQFGVHVTGVDHGGKLDFMRSLGYDEVINYKEVDFTKTGEKYDLILDARSTRNPSAYRRSLNPNGRFVTVGGTIPKLLRIFLASKRGKDKQGRSVAVLAVVPNKDLEQMNKWFEEGVIRPEIDGPYPLEKAGWAIARFGKADHLGKVIIEINTSNK